MQAWANVYHGEDSSGGAGRPDSAGFATTELVSAPAEGLSIEDVWDKKYSGFFKDLDSQLNAERRVFVKEGKESGRGEVDVDMTFVMDCTGSMGKHIANGRTYISGTIDMVKREVKKQLKKDVNFRVAFVAYRDFGDDGHLRVTPFTTDLEACKKAVTEEEPSGWGGDIPEDVAGGLMMASGLQWRPRSANFLILICDAPCHNVPGKVFHGSDIKDIWTQAETDPVKTRHDPRAGAYGGLTAVPRKDPDDALKYLRDTHKVHFMVTQMTTGTTTQMIQKFEAEYNKPGKFELKRLSTDPSKVTENVHMMCKEIADTITTSIRFNFW